MHYKIKWRLLSPIETQLHSDTIFGHLCWAIAYRHGEERLKGFLQAMEQPVLILSSGFPQGSLPLPQLPNETYIEPGASLTQARLFMETRKQAKKLGYMSIEKFQAAMSNYQHGKFIAQNLLLKEFLHKQFSKNLQFHNSIDRNTGTTTKGTASLFAETSEFAPTDTILESYLSTEYFSREELQTLLTDIQYSGFGRNKSTGKGKFEIELEPYTPLTTPEPNAWLLLSNLVPAATDSPAAYYTSLTKFGKLGGAYAASGKNPFKKPLMLFSPGSVFLGKAPVGTMVHNIHPDDSSIVQYAYAYSIGFRIAGGPDA